MKTRPIEPGRFEGEAPAAEAPLLMGGTGLPGRWAGRRHFTVLQIGFGLGQYFLALWDSWRADPRRCEFLHVVCVERHPPLRADLERALQGSPWPGLAADLVAAWPPLTPNVHALDFDRGQVRLLLAFGDPADLLPALRYQADAFFVGRVAAGGHPEMPRNRMLKALGRRAAPGAILATRGMASDWRDGLGAAGFEMEPRDHRLGTGGLIVARWAPRFAVRSLPQDAISQPAARTAVVVGAGLAGAAAAGALAALGLQVTVLERHAAPAQGASGNVAGLFHGSVNADDGPYARLFRATALQARRDCARAVAEGRVNGQLQGLLRVAPDGTDVALLADLLRKQGLPPDYVQALDAAQASAMAGVPLRSAAWYYPGGGWLAPAEWAADVLASVRFVGGVTVSSLAPGPDGRSADWMLRDSAGLVVAQAPIVVLAYGARAAQLLAPLGPEQGLGWPLAHTRGQITQCQGAAGALARPVAGDGYAIALPDGSLLCGATRQPEEPDLGEDQSPLREEDHRHNLDRLQRLTGLMPQDDAKPLGGRAGWRLQADDRLPIAGGVPAWPVGGHQRLDQARLVPRHQGLFVLTALGARGLTLAPLLGRLVAAQATGTPWPLEQDLADAVDPARWLVRDVRYASRSEEDGQASNPDRAQVPAD